MNKKLSKNRLREAFSEIKEAAGGGGLTVSDAENVLDLSKRSVSLILSELVEEGLIVRTGRGIYAFSKKLTPLVSLELLLPITPINGSSSGDLMRGHNVRT